MKAVGAQRWRPSAACIVPPESRTENKEPCGATRRAALSIGGGASAKVVEKKRMKNTMRRGGRTGEEGIWLQIGACVPSCQILTEFCLSSKWSKYFFTARAKSKSRANEIRR